MTRSSKSSSLSRTLIDDIPDEWRSITDIPQIEEMITHIKRDPIFRDSFFFQETNNPDNLDSGIYQPLVDYQGHIHETLDQNEVIWIQAARGSAKSSTFARWLDGYCLDEPMVKAGLFAPSFRQSKQLHDYCVSYMTANFGVDSHVYKLDTEWLTEPIRGQEVLMKYKNGSFIEALPSGDGGKLRGKRFNVIGIDEAYQLQKEFHESHIMPMGNVKVGNRRTKTIYMTTSWYTDVYAYTILQDIARNIAAGVPGYAIIDIRLNDVLMSGFPFDKKHILHQLEMGYDKEAKHLSDEAKMTFFNIWIKSGANFYTPSMITDCQRAEINVVEKTPEGDTTPTVLGVDPATVGEDKCAMSIIACPGNDERQLRATYQFTKLRPEEIAGNIHKMVDLHKETKIILLDKTGALGINIADLCAKPTQLIDGVWQKRTPIMLWDHPEARNARAHIVLTLPSDDRILLGVMGPRVDSSISGEIGLKNTFHTAMKQKMLNGKFFTPKLLKDEDYYNSERGEIMDNITESLAQFPKIDRKKAADGKTLLTDARGNFYFTRPSHDDGAYSIIYANFAANIHYRLQEGSQRSEEIPFVWGSSSDEEKYRNEVGHKIVLPRF